MLNEHDKCSIRYNARDYYEMYCTLENSNNQWVP